MKTGLFCLLTLRDTGAFVCLTQELTIDECVELFNDYAATHNQNVAKQLRYAQTVKSGTVDPRDMNINTVRISALRLMEAHKARLGHK